MLRFLKSLIALVALAMLASCGGSKVESQLIPTRIISFGDSLSDLGSFGKKFTVNGSDATIWVERVASSFGLSGVSVQPAFVSGIATGGLAYAQGRVRVTIDSDVDGSSATMTVREQIDDMIMNRGGFQSNDLVLVMAGASDLLVNLSTNPSGLNAAMDLAARDLADQVQRMVQAGANYVAVAALPDLGRTPHAVVLGQQAAMSGATRKFNDRLKVRLQNLGLADWVLYVDTEHHFNLVLTTPSSYSFTNTTEPVCVNAPVGAFSSFDCDAPADLVPGADPSKYVFADQLHPTPAMHRSLGDFVYGRIRNRF